MAAPIDADVQLRINYDIIWAGNLINHYCVKKVNHCKHKQLKYRFLFLCIL